MNLITGLFWALLILNPYSESEVKINRNMRTVKAIHKAEYSKIEDLITYRALPTRSATMESFEPFLFLNHHGPQVYQPNNRGLPFGPHPHKGFETVTFILKGDILHKDTEGHESVITAGGIQWMTAGRGVVHSEVSSKEFKEKGGELEILQLWVNLPARLKSVKPNYIGLQKKDIPELSLDEGKVTVHLVSGHWNKTLAPVQSVSDVHLTYVNFKPGGSLKTTVDTSRAVFLYIISGNLNVNGKSVNSFNLVEFSDDGETIDIQASSDAIIIFGHAKRLREPIVARGPFVMNTAEEIQQAYEEYFDGKFGNLE